MIQLYDLNKTKLQGLKNYKDLKVERELSGDEVLSFSYLNLDSKYDSIKEECYIRTRKNEYVVKEINIQDDWTEFVTKINIEDIKGKVISNFETVEQTCTNAVNLALVGTGWTIGSCDITKKRTVRKANCSSYDILQEIRKIYLCDFKFDAINKKIYIYSSMGSDKGVYFSDSLNLRKLDIQSNSYDFATRIIPIGKDGLKITAINNGKEYVENYQYSTKVITAYWEDNRYTVVESLREDAIAKLNELSKPFKSYSADIIDLASLNDKYKNILDYDLGDTITLISKDKKVKEKQRIVKLIEYPDEPEKNTCEIANKTLRFEDIQADNQDVIDAADSVITSDGMIDNSKVNFNPIRIEVTTLIAEKANIGELNAAVARIGDLEATKANITDLTAINASITDLQASKANITDLTATNGRITTLEADTASINNLLAGNIGVENLQANLITAESGLIAYGAIKDAMIETLSVSKILAGNISTNKFVVTSDSGNLKIQGNTLKVWDTSGKERVSLGLNGSDYNLLIRGSDGNTVLFGVDGVTNAGITEGAVDDSKIDANANINGSKIEKESLVTQINGATTTINASKIKLDTENQILELAFTTLKSTVTDTSDTVTSQGTAISVIQGQIQAKIWEQDITTATDGLETRISATETSITALNNSINLKVETSTYTSKMSSVDGSINTLTTTLNSAKSDISVLQGQISLKVEQSDITTAINNVQIGGRNLVTNSDVLKGYFSTLGGYTGVRTVINDSEALSGKHIEFKCTTSGTGFHCPIFPKSTDKVGNIYTWSFYTKCSVLKTGNVGHESGGQKSISLTTEWQKFTHTFTFLNGTYSSFTFYMGWNVGEILYIRDFKIEKGNKATDWTPAPEDITTEIDTAISTAKAEIKITTDSITSSVSSVQSSVSSLGIRVTSAESSITSLSNSITLKVSTTDFNSYTTTNDSAVNSKASQADLTTTNGNVSVLTTRVTNSESSISVLQGQIVSKVSQTDIDNSLATQEFGNDQKIFNNVLGISSAPITGALVIDTPITAGAYMTRLDISGYTYSGNNADLDCSISFYIYTTKLFYNYSYTSNGTFDISRVRLALNENNKVVIIINDINTSWAYPKITINKVSIGHTLPPDSFKNGWTSSFKTVIPTTYTQLTEVSIKKITESTSGSQARIDNFNTNTVQPIVTRVSTAESSISQLSNSITLKVDTSTYNSRMSGIDGSISSLDSRMNSAELKITDSAIVSTVTSSEIWTDRQEEIDAINTAALEQGLISTNPVFKNWGGTHANYPSGMNYWSGTTGHKETTYTRNGGNALRFNLGLNVDGGATLGSGFFKGSIANSKYLTVELDFYLVSGDASSGAGVLLDWNGMSSYRTNYKLSEMLCEPIVTGRWYSVSKVFKRPTDTLTGYTNMSGYLMANWSGLGARTAKDIVYDRLAVRMSTEEEIKSYEADLKLADIANDNKLTESEKQTTKGEWDIIVAEKPTIEAQATTYGITTEKTNFINSYNTLNTYITPLLADLTTTSDITGTTFRNTFKDYYDKKAILLKKISDLSNFNLNAVSARVTTAESSITQLNNSISLKINATDVASTYSTKSELTQTTDSITAKFSSSGGANFIKNSKFKNSFSQWTMWGSPPTRTIGNYNQNGSESDTALQLVTNASNQGVLQSISGLSINKVYTVRARIFVGSGVPTIMFYRGGSYWTWTWSTSYGSTGTWHTIAFEYTPNSATDSIYVGKSGGGATGTYYFTNISMTEGSIKDLNNKVIAPEWTPHPSEIYEGSTVIDSSGITVNNGALTVKNNAGQTVMCGDSNGNLLVQNTVTVGGSTDGTIQVQNSFGTTIFSAGKNGAFIKDDVLKITSGTITGVGGITYPEGNTNEARLQAYGSYLEQYEVAGSQQTFKIGRYYANNWQVALDNSYNSSQDYYSTYADGTQLHLSYYVVNNGLQLQTRTTLTHTQIDTGTVYTDNWFRSTGSTGWFSQTWGGGWHMTDSTWIRAYGSKSIYTPSNMQADGSVSGITLKGNRLQGRGSADSFNVGSGNTRLDTNSGQWRIYTSAVGSNDYGINIATDGTVNFKFNNTTIHQFRSNGGKTGGSIKIEGTTYGMSPVDSPKSLIEDLLLDISIEELGTTIELNPIYVKSIHKYGVFCSNGKVEIISKNTNSFTVKGYTGICDFRIVGTRIDERDQDYVIMGGFEHGVEEDVSC